MDDMNSPAVEAPAQPAGPPSFRTEYRPDEGFALELRGLDDAQLFNADGTPQTITLLGNDSDVAVRARHSQSNRRLQSGQRLKLTSEGLESDGASYLAKLVTTWNITPSLLAPGAPLDLPGGDRPPYSYEAAVKLFSSRLHAFIKEQADTGIAERANFLKRLPAT
jgi:hypothetical protein